MATGSRLLTLEEVAVELRISIRTVRRRVDAGDIKAIAVGPRSRRVRESELAAYVRQKERGARE